ncbi:MAG: MFS transporter, partial [Bdellovibrionaceae bacterium]|nr:MFS transporter [Pseudobdellovibrionaceae bacterium]
MSRTADMSRLVRLYTLFQFFFGLLLWLPIFYEYQKRMGLSEANIFEIQSLYQIVFCFLELPTGWFADRFGYLRSLRAGAWTLIFANVLPVFAVDYSGFLAHFVLIALARSFISGASSAYLYEVLKERGQTGAYQGIEGAARSYGLIGKVVGWAGVGALMQWHVTLPYWLTVLAAAASLGFALALPHLAHENGSAKADKKTDQNTERRSSTANLISAFTALSRTPSLILLMLQGVAIFVLSRAALVTLFQPILTDKSIPLAGHGLVMSALTLFEALGSFRP